jgi:rare lipoprotein A
MIALTGGVLAACAAAPTQHSSEYFPESKYGKASPRVASGYGPIRRGGGRYQLGDPYEVAGTWYYPTVNPRYSKVGRASWYGSAFHGRLTANGEVYDMNSLSAASPTLPLPCYARVTNLSNGSSVIVRVNDRGPFARGRVIDLSARAARMLAYKDGGTAKVKVDYVGPAPLEGNDQPYLLASYRPGEGDGMGQPASGVMLAMNDSAPTRISRQVAPARVEPAATYQLASLAPIPEPASNNPAEAAVNDVALAPVHMIAPGDPALPAIGPVLPDRPEGFIADARPAGFDLARIGSIHGLVNSYAEQTAGSRSGASAAIERMLNPASIARSWMASHGSPASQSASGEPDSDYINLGLFANQADAQRIATELSGFGQIRRSRVPTGSATLEALALVPGDGTDTDAVLQAAWQAGAKNAFTVRVSER